MRALGRILRNASTRPSSFSVAYRLFPVACSTYQSRTIDDGSWRTLFGCRMKILFTGAGRHGSWQMRGIQLAAQRASWRAVSNATKTDLSNVDVVVVVKNAGDDTLNLLRHWKGTDSL